MCSQSISGSQVSPRSTRPDGVPIDRVVAAADRWIGRRHRTATDCFGSPSGTPGDHRSRFGSYFALTVPTKRGSCDDRGNPSRPRPGHPADRQVGGEHHRDVVDGCGAGGELGASGDADGVGAGGVHAVAAGICGSTRICRCGANRDRFVLSVGHASALLYSSLSGVKSVNPDYETVGTPAVSLDDLKRFGGGDAGRAPEA
jgi:hypothetical protein